MATSEVVFSYDFSAPSGFSDTWGVNNADAIFVDDIGGQSGVLEVRDGGGWSDACTSFDAIPGHIYTIEADVHVDTLMEGVCANGAVYLFTAR
jgi:hypothetical protein